MINKKFIAMLMLIFTLDIFAKVATPPTMLIHWPNNFIATVVISESNLISSSETIPTNKRSVKIFVSGVQSDFVKIKIQPESETEHEYRGASLLIHYHHKTKKHSIWVHLKNRPVRQIMGTLPCQGAKRFNELCKILVFNKLDKLSLMETPSTSKLKYKLLDSIFTKNHTTYLTRDVVIGNSLSIKNMTEKNILVSQTVFNDYVKSNNSHWPKTIITENNLQKNRVQIDITHVVVNPIFSKKEFNSKHLRRK